MTTSEYAQLILEVKKENPTPPMVDETAAYEAAQFMHTAGRLPPQGRGRLTKPSPKINMRVA